MHVKYINTLSEFTCNIMMPRGSLQGTFLQLAKVFEKKIPNPSKSLPLRPYEKNQFFKLKNIYHDNASCRLDIVCNLDIAFWWELNLRSQKWRLHISGLLLGYLTTRTLRSYSSTSKIT